VHGGRARFVAADLFFFCSSTATGDPHAVDGPGSL
jgi:hypothetical protein